MGRSARIRCAALGILSALGLTLAACAQSARATEGQREIGAGGPVETGGQPPQAQAGRETQVRVRLRNHSDSALQDVSVRFPADSEHIDFLRPGAYSRYFTVDSAYRYASIQAKSGGKEYFCQPMDFTGETPLAPGRYTYDLTQVKNRDKDATIGFFLLELIDDTGHP